MVTCAVPGCKSCKRNNPHCYSFHTFPLNNEVRLEWLQMIKREDWNPKKYSTICSKHFEEKCFSDIRDSQRVKLRSGSVPTLSLPYHGPIKNTKQKSTSQSPRDPLIINTPLVKTEDVKPRNVSKFIKTTNQTSENDECSTFGVLIAQKLRKLTDLRRDYVMARINQIFYEEHSEIKLPRLSISADCPDVSVPTISSCVSVKEESMSSNDDDIDYTIITVKSEVGNEYIIKD